VASPTTAPRASSAAAVTMPTRFRALCIADVVVTCPKTHPPETELGEIRALFGDVHVHMALIVTPGG
jgi:hypothetical protein